MMTDDMRHKSLIIELLMTWAKSWALPVENNTDV